MFYMKKTVLFGTLTLACGVAAQAQSSRPNVILILADDLGFGDLSCYGAQLIKTPHVDSLAQAGIRFTNAHACAATSTPSRYSLLTGQYPFRQRGTDVAAGNAASIIKSEQTTVADVFKQAGYRTAAIGKWHLGLGSVTAQQDWNGTLDVTPADLGFDYHYIMAATADRVPCVYIEQGRVANYDPSAPIEVSYQQNFAGEPTGRENPELLTKLRPSHGHDQSVVNGISRIGYMKGGGAALWRDEDIADSIATHAVEFIAQNASTPFFLYLCTNDVHVPRMPHERFRGKSAMGLRGEAILQFDETVGKVTQALRELGIADNTLIILTSDNGPVLDDGYEEQAEELANGHQAGGPWRGGKYSSYEAGSVVPFIVSGAGCRGKGKVSDALISHIDCLASMAALTNQDLSFAKNTDSQNHLKTWLGKNKSNRPFAIKMAYNHTLSLRANNWKYIPPKVGPSHVPWGTGIETGNSPEPQLYNIKKDPAEKKNLAKERPDLVECYQLWIEDIRGGK